MRDSVATSAGLEPEGECEMQLLEDLPECVREDIAQARAPLDPVGFWIRYVPLVLLYLLVVAGPLVTHLWID